MPRQDFKFHLHSLAGPVFFIVVFFNPANIVIIKLCFQDIINTASILMCPKKASKETNKQPNETNNNKKTKTKSQKQNN